MTATWNRAARKCEGMYRFYDGRLMGVRLECAVGKGSPAGKLAVEHFVERMANDDPDVFSRLVLVQFAPDMPWIKIILTSVPERERGVWYKQARHNLHKLAWPEFGLPYASLSKPLQVSVEIEHDPEYLSCLGGLDESNLNKVYEEPAGAWA